MSSAIAGLSYAGVRSVAVSQLRLTHLRKGVKEAGVVHKLEPLRGNSVMRKRVSPDPEELED